MSVNCAFVCGYVCLNVLDVCNGFNAAVDLSPIDICDVVRHNLNLPLQIRMQCIIMFHLSLDLIQPERVKLGKKYTESD